MATKIVDTILPTTMVGSYPRPHWFNQQLLGRDIRVAFKEVAARRGVRGCDARVIRDQEEAGLDIVTDGQMWFDDYVGVIGSFCWYMYERIPGFDPRSEPHPSRSRRAERDQGDRAAGRLGRRDQQRPGQRAARSAWPTSTRSPRKHANKPMKVSVGAGPINLAWHVYFKHYKDPKELSYALAPIFNAEMKELVAAGATYLQLEDLGAWLPLFTGDKDDYKWIARRHRAVLRRRRREDRLALLLRQRLGQRHPQRQLPRGLPDGAAVLLRDAGIDQFVLDFANREMAGIEFLKNAAVDKEVAIGVLDIRTRWSRRRSRSPTASARCSRSCPPERVDLTTDCGMKPLARMVAKMKLKALAEGAEIVRSEIA